MVDGAQGSRQLGDLLERLVGICGAVEFAATSPARASISLAQPPLLEHEVVFAATAAWQPTFTSSFSSAAVASAAAASGGSLRLRALALHDDDDADAFAFGRLVPLHLRQWSPWDGWRLPPEGPAGTEESRVQGYVGTTTETKGARRPWLVELTSERVAQEQVPRIADEMLRFAASLRGRFLQPPVRVTLPNPALPRKSWHLTEDWSLSRPSGPLVLSPAMMRSRPAPAAPTAAAVTPAATPAAAGQLALAKWRLRRRWLSACSAAAAEDAQFARLELQLQQYHHNIQQQALLASTSSAVASEAVDEVVEDKLPHGSLAAAIAAASAHRELSDHRQMLRSEADAHPTRHHHHTVYHSEGSDDGTGSSRAASRVPPPLSALDLPVGNQSFAPPLPSPSAAAADLTALVLDLDDVSLLDVRDADVDPAPAALRQVPSRSPPLSQPAPALPHTRPPLAPPPHARRPPLAAAAAAPSSFLTRDWSLSSDGDDGGSDDGDDADDVDNDENAVDDDSECAGVVSGSVARATVGVRHASVGLAGAPILPVRGAASTPLRVAATQALQDSPRTAGPRTVRYQPPPNGTARGSLDFGRDSPSRPKTSSYDLARKERSWMTREADLLDQLRCTAEERDAAVAGRERSDAAAAALATEARQLRRDKALLEKNLKASAVLPTKRERQEMDQLRQQNSALRRRIRDLELEAGLAAERARDRAEALKGRVAELEDEVRSLEDDRLRLKSDLKAAAAAQKFLTR
ncbi:hypothetical protein HK405_000204 [Cladochytrium tenue]|nr:hypothetical protein HK405_000204 [Cladochytrium tenue]